MSEKKSAAATPVTIPWRVIAISMLLIIVGLTALMIIKSNRENAAAEAEVTRIEAMPALTRPLVNPVAIAKAEATLRKEAKVIDLLYDEGETVEWTIAVRDDGSRRYGYAGYVCMVLREFGVLHHDSHVRIADAERIAREGASFREADLGTIRCRDDRRLD